MLLRCTTCCSDSLVFEEINDTHLEELMPHLFPVQNTPILPRWLLLHDTTPLNQPPVPCITGVNLTYLLLSVTFRGIFESIW